MYFEDFSLRTEVRGEGGRTTDLTSTLLITSLEVHGKTWYSTGTLTFGEHRLVFLLWTQGLWYLEVRLVPNGRRSKDLVIFLYRKVKKIR